MDLLPSLTKFTLLFCALVLGTPAAVAQSLPFMTGVDANFAPGMAASGMGWKVSGSAVDLFTALRAAGVDSFRVRVWTVASGSGSTSSAIAVAQQAQKAGMKPYLVFFLSDNWADYIKQPVPVAWAKLSFTDKLAAVEEYSEQTARSFNQAGVVTSLYEIGNEIDFGICGEFETSWGNRFNFPYMEANVWPREAQIICAAEKGILKVNPKARFILHSAQWWNPAFCSAFASAIVRNSAKLDYLGLSFYPTSGLSPEQTFADLERNVKSIDRQVIICETGYPSQSNFSGQFSTWNVAVPNYPLTTAGQQQWLADAVTFCRSQKNISGFFYWSPEWNDDMWSAFSLFDSTGNAKPALNSL